MLKEDEVKNPTIRNLVKNVFQRITKKTFFHLLFNTHLFELNLTNNTIAFFCCIVTEYNDRSICFHLWDWCCIWRAVMLSIQSVFQRQHSEEPTSSLGRMHNLKYLWHLGRFNLFTVQEAFLDQKHQAEAELRLCISFSSACVFLCLSSSLSPSVSLPPLSSHTPTSPSPTSFFHIFRQQCYTSFVS